MPPSVSSFLELCARIALLDWLALLFFVAAVVGYRSFLSMILLARPERLYLGKLQAYRNAWIAAHSGDQNSLVTVQTLRNNIMTASFLASTAIILIMGAFSLLGNLHGLVETLRVFRPGPPTEPAVELLKILLIIVTLWYCFFNFTSHIRQVNYMSLILNIPKERLDEIEGGDSTPLLSQIFLSSGIHFSMGMRGYYFLIPLFMWVFSPVLMIATTLLIMLTLLKRDLQG
jgi:uncharacterized membrane protein